MCHYIYSLFIFIIAKASMVWFPFFIHELIKAVVEYINRSFIVMVIIFALWCPIIEPDKSRFRLEETDRDHTVELVSHWQGKQSRDKLYSYHLCFLSLLHSLTTEACIRSLWQPKFLSRNDWNNNLSCLIDIWVAVKKEKTKCHLSYCSDPLLSS